MSGYIPHTCFRVGEVFVHSRLYRRVSTTHLGVFLFQAEDWFRDRTQTAGRQGGAAHPGLYDAHEHLHTGQ